MLLPHWKLLLASIFCHVRNMIMKYMGENVTKIYISAKNENRFFCYIHAHSIKNYVYDGFIRYPTLW